jgi:hypothetical protein
VSRPADATGEAQGRRLAWRIATRRGANESQPGGAAATSAAARAGRREAGPRDVEHHRLAAAVRRHTVAVPPPSAGRAPVRVSASAATVAAAVTDPRP